MKSLIQHIALIAELMAHSDSVEDEITECAEAFGLKVELVREFAKYKYDRTYCDDSEVA